MSSTHVHRISLLEAYFQCNSYERCVEIWLRKCPNILAPCKNTLYQLVYHFHDSGSVDDRQQSGRPKVVTPDFISDVQQQILRSPQKSVWHLSQQKGASHGFTHKALKNLKFLAYRVTDFLYRRSMVAPDSVPYMKYRIFSNLMRTLFTVLEG
jgi:hypothetical protein